MVLVATLPELKAIQHWPFPPMARTGWISTHAANLLYVACDGGLLVEVDVRSGQTQREWPLAAVPDATFL